MLGLLRFLSVNGEEKREKNVLFFLKVTVFSIVKRRIILDEKKNAAALRRIRLPVKEVMLTDEFQKWSVKVLGYAANEWQLEAAGKSHGLFNKPWVKLFPNIGNT